MTPQLSDARLARQATEGDQRAFAAIYRRHHQGLYRFCLSIMGRPEDAQEALQNTMVKALRSLPGEERQIKLKPWLYRVAHNESVDLLRRRRDGPELDDSRASGTADLTETVALRERLERLLGDLDALPERQRAALVMRELAGLAYEQIGEAFDTSISVARQTVYEARLNLREQEAGREMRCDEVTRQLSEADGRVVRRRGIQAHLRACPDCRTFRDAIQSRRRDLAALSPLPAAAAASILQGLAGGQAATGVVGAGAAASGIGAGAGKVAATSVAFKAVATVAVVATVGVTAADRGNLIDIGLSGDAANNTQELERPADGAASGATAPSANPATGPARGASNSAKRADASIDSRHAAKPINAAVPSGGGENGAKEESVPPPSNRSANGNGPPPTLPEASRHGQETAASHKAGGRGSSKARGNAPPKGAKAGRSASGKGHGGAAAHGPPDHAQSGGNGKSRPKDSDQPAVGEHPSEAEAKTGDAPGAEQASGNGQTHSTSP